MTLALDDTVHQQSHSLISQILWNILLVTGFVRHTYVRMQKYNLYTWYVLGKVTKERES